MFSVLWIDSPGRDEVGGSGIEELGFVMGRT